MRNTIHRSIGITCVLLVAACSSNTATPPLAPRTVSSVKPSTSSSPFPNQPAPVTMVAKAAPPAPPAPTAPTTVAFVPVYADPVVEVDAPPRLMLFDAGDDIFVARDSGGFGSRFGRLLDEEVRWEKSLFVSGYSPQVVRIVADWPKSFEILVTLVTGRTGIAERYRLERGVLRQVFYSQGETYRGHVRFKGVDHALRSHWLGSGAPRIDSMTPGGTKYRFPVHPKASKCKRGYASFLPYGYLPETIGVSPRGELVVVASGCTGIPNVVLTWKGGGEPTITPTTAELKRGARFFPTPSGDDAYVVSHNVHLFADGKLPVAVAPPPGFSFSGSAAAQTKDGALWLVGEKGPPNNLTRRLYRFDGKSLEVQPMPGDVLVDSVAVDAQDVVWATSGSVLLRRGKGRAQALNVNRDAFGKKSAGRHRDIQPGSARCGSNIVVLYGFTKVTPPDYDFPLTRKAVAGRFEYKKTQFLVTQDSGKKFFVAKPESFATAKKLAALIEKKVVGSKPQIICADPEVLREIKVNLADGSVLP